MQKILIADGYNVINAIPELEAKIGQSLEAARMALAQYLFPWKNSFEIYIVFDGRSNTVWDNNSVLYGIKCIFSQGKEEADDCIISMVRDFSSKNADITVITNDNYIRNNCRAYAAKVEPANYLIKKSKTARLKYNEAPSSAETIDSAAEKRINDSLKKIWHIK